MVLPIGFFAPLPLAIMIPFMAAQSFAMGQAFGTSFQYGKRKISSMSNEEFNAITAVEIADNLQSDVRAMIPSMNESFHRMETFQIDILDSMVRTMLKAVEKFFEFIGPTGGGVNPYVGTGGLDAAGQHALEQGFPEWVPHAHGEDSPPPPPSSDEVTYTANEKYAMRWIDPVRKTTNFNNITIKEARFLLDLFAAGRLPNMLFARRPLLAKWEELQPKITPPGTVPPGSGKIATDFGVLVALIDEIRRLKNKLAKRGYVGEAGRQQVLTRIRNKTKRFLLLGSAWNRYVASIRKHGLSIDTAKSLAAGKIIPKS